MRNLAKTFRAAGSSLDHVVEAQVFLTDLSHFHGFDSVWKRHFKAPQPRTTRSTAAEPPAAGGMPLPRPALPAIIFACGNIRTAAWVAHEN